MANADFPTVDPSDRIFINQSLCSYYWLLPLTSKKLHRKGKIFGWYVLKRTIKIKLQENSVPIYTSHMMDFRKHFPDIELENM